MKKKRSGAVDVLVQTAIYIYLINAICKYFLPNLFTKILPIVAVVLAALRYPTPLKLKVSTMDKLFLLFASVWFVGCIYSPAMTKGLGYVFSFALALLLSIYTCKKNIPESNIMRLLSGASLIMAIFVIIQPIAPDFVSGINHLFSYQSNEYAIMQAWTRNGWYSGLFPDRAPAAFFCCVLIGTGLYYIYFNYGKSGSLFKRFWGIVFSLTGTYGIMMTAKRGLLVGAGIAAFISFIVYKKANKEPIWKICLAAGEIVVVIWIAFSNMPATQIMMKRFVDNENPLTYRAVIYSNIFERFWSSPLVGTGTASAYSLLGIGGHNIYLTVLMENGMLGFMLLIVALVYSLGHTVLIAMRFGRYSYDNTIPFLLFSIYIQVFFLVYGMSGNPLYDNYILYFYIFSVLIAKNAEHNLAIAIEREE